MSETRQHETEITLPASPEEVWRAITDASQVQVWCAPEVYIDGREGGEYRLSWGPGMEGTNTIEVFENNRHLRMSSERRGARIAVDFFLETAGGGTKLRLVHSGFLTSSDWDNEYNGTRMGWPVMMRILRYSLAAHPGVAGRQKWIYGTTSAAPSEAWRKFAGWFRDTPVVYSAEPSEFCAPWAEPGDGLVYAAFAERNGITGISLTLVLYGEAAARMEAAEEDWKMRLNSLAQAATAGK